MTENKWIRLRWCIARKCTRQRFFIALIFVFLCTISILASIMIIKYWHKEMIIQLLPGQCVTHDCEQSKLCCCDIDYTMDAHQPFNKTIDAFRSKQCIDLPTGCNQGIWRKGSRFGCWSTLEHVLWFSYPATRILNLLSVVGHLACWRLVTIFCFSRTKDVRVSNLPTHLWTNDEPKDRYLSYQSPGLTNSGHLVNDGLLKPNLSLPAYLTSLSEEKNNVESTIDHDFDITQDLCEEDQRIMSDAEEGLVFGPSSPNFDHLANVIRDM